MSRKKKTGQFMFRFVIGSVASTQRSSQYVHEISTITFFDGSSNDTSIPEKDYEHFLKVFPNLQDYFEGTVFNDEGGIVCYGLSYASEITTALTMEDFEIINEEFQKNINRKEKLLAADRRALEYLEWFHKKIEWAVKNCIRPGCFHETYWVNP